MRAELRLDVLFARVAAALQPGGAFIFDAVARPRDDVMSYTAERSGHDWHLSIDVAEEPQRRLLRRDIIIVRGAGAERSRTREVHYLRTLDPTEVADSLTGLGFEVELAAQYGDMAVPPGRFVCFARKLAL